MKWQKKYQKPIIRTVTPITLPLIVNLNLFRKSITDYQ